MIALPPQQTKTCSKCYRRLPTESFRFSNKAAGLRHTVCRDCRNQYEQNRRSSQRQRALGHGLQEIRYAETVERMWNIAQNICSQLGGLDNFLVMFRDRILDEQTSSACRVSASRALMHMVIVSDRERQRLGELEIQILQDELRQVRMEEADWDGVPESHDDET